jgi:hypothetical protein
MTKWKTLQSKLFCARTTRGVGRDGTWGSSGAGVIADHCSGGLGDNAIARCGGGLGGGAIGDSGLESVIARCDFSLAARAAALLAHATGPWPRDERRLFLRNMSNGISNNEKK